MAGKKIKAAIAALGSAVLFAGIAIGPDSAVASPNHATAGGSSAKESVIVVLRDQLASTPVRRAGMTARTARAESTQNAVLHSLSGPAASHVIHFSVGNAFSATVTAAQAAALAANPAVASVTRDAKIAATPAVAATPASTSHSSKAAVRPNDSVQGPFAVCPSDPAQPLVEPEALNTIHAYSTDGSPSAQDLTDGSGVKVAYIADGIDPDNPNFIRPDGDHAIVDYVDFSGDGPDSPGGGAEAFGDASAIAAQGTVTYDLSQFVNAAYPLPAGCNVRILGVAPGASIVAIKAGGEFLTNSSILQSIDYAVRVAHVDVINESFVLNRFPDSSNRATVQLFNDNAVAAGVTVTVGAGDGGVNGTIGSDATDPKVISAGASTDSQFYEQTGYGGARAFGNGKWADNEISALSSGGYTNSGRTVDLVAPGDTDWASCEASPFFAQCTNFNGGLTDIQAFGGTSQSSPLTAGVAALVISAYRTTHAGASPTPAVVKKIITGTTTDLGLPGYEQGSGLLNARAATEAALTYPGSSGDIPAGVQSNIITSTDQVNLTGLPGTTQTGTVKVTNVGDTTTTVAAGTRGYSKLSDAGQAVTFDSTDAQMPTFPFPTYGGPWVYKKVTFNVPGGASRLLAQLAWAARQPPATDAVVWLSLFAPDGTYVANSRPGGFTPTPNYANVDVRNPDPGTWTAVMYSPAGAIGYTGLVGLRTQTFRSVPVGSVSPATFKLAPGASRDVTFNFTLPSTASGDTDYNVTLADSAGRQTSVTAVVRSLIPTAGGGGTFSGDVTGGNGRPDAPGETFSYSFDVPAGRAALDTSVVPEFKPNSVMDLVLIDPNNELADVATNVAVNHAKTTLEIRKTMQSFIDHPIPGRWVLVVVVQNPVSGTAFDDPFTGRISFAPVPVDRGGLPSSAAHHLKAGSTQSYTVSVTNSGVESILVGADPRLNQVVTLQPVPIQGQSTFALPPDPSQAPVFDIPPDTSKLTVAAVSTTPAQLELQGSAAGFDLFGDLASAQNGDLLSTTHVSEAGNGAYISKGIWFTAIQQIGPFTDDGAPAGSTTITASMQTLAFDPAVTSSTGDPFGNAVDPNNIGFTARSPLYLAPGQTGTINVTVHVTAPKGTDVSGLLNLVTLPNLPSGAGGLPSTTTGEVVRAIPYEYTVN